MNKTSKIVPNVLLQNLVTLKHIWKEKINCVFRIGKIPRDKT